MFSGLFLFLFAKRFPKNGTLRIICVIVPSPWDGDRHAGAHALPREDVDGATVVVHDPLCYREPKS